MTYYLINFDKKRRGKWILCSKYGLQKKTFFQFWICWVFRQCHHKAASTFKQPWKFRNRVTRFSGGRTGIESDGWRRGGWGNGLTHAFNIYDISRTTTPPQCAQRSSRLGPQRFFRPPPPSPPGHTPVQNAKPELWIQKQKCQTNFCSEWKRGRTEASRALKTASIETWEYSAIGDH